MQRDTGSADSQETFGDLLRRHRRMAGLSQEALAERAGLSRRGLADLERGARRSPYPDTARRLAGALDLDGADRTAFMAACRPRPARPSSPYELRIDLSPLVGREAELAHACRLAADHRLLTLTGTAGVGKTRLAFEVAHRISDRFPDGTVLVDLAPLVDAATVPDAVASSLAVRPRPGESVSHAIGRQAEDKQLLLVLDNCEHVITACAHLSDELLRSTAGLHLLATSREPLRILGETVWAVHPLTPTESVELFTERVIAADATTELADAELGMITDICARLEGIPLAIELAAVRVPALGVAQVEELMTDRFRLLSRGSRVAAQRHQTLHAALDWSFALLEPVDQRVFSRLAVFAGGWSLDSARSVCGGRELSPEAVTEAVAALVDKSLAVTVDEGGRRRYRFLDTIREYALEQLTRSGEREETRARFAEYFRAFADHDTMTRVGIRFPGDISRVRMEHANLNAALRWLLDRRMLKEGLELCYALSGFWLSQGFLREGRDWLTAFLADSQAAAPVAYADGLRAKARIVEYGGDLERARDLFEQSLRIGAAGDDATIRARALTGLGDVEVHHGRYEQAKALYRQALDAARSAESATDTAQALLCLGRVSELTGDPTQSQARLEQALAIGRQLKDRWEIGYALTELGINTRRSGRLERAQAIFEECLENYRAAGTLMGERSAIMNLAQTALERDLVAAAAEYALESFDLSHQMQDYESSTTVRCVEIAAQVLLRPGATADSTADAVALIAAATKQRERLRSPRPGLEQAELDRLLPGAQDTLGPTRFEDAWRRGLGLRIQDAMDLAATMLPSH